MSQHLRRFVVFSSLFSIAVGLVGLSGCVFRIPILRTVLPGLVAIKANTTVCLILLGLSLWLLRESDTRAGTLAAKWMPKTASAIVILVGLLCGGLRVG